MRISSCFCFIPDLQNFTDLPASLENLLLNELWAVCTSGQLITSPKHWRPWNIYHFEAISYYYHHEWRIKRWYSQRNCMLIKDDLSSFFRKEREDYRDKKYFTLGCTSLPFHYLLTSFQISPQKPKSMFFSKTRTGNSLIK